MQRGLLAGNSFLKHLADIFLVHGFQGTVTECNHHLGPFFFLLFFKLCDMSLGQAWRDIMNPSDLIYTKPERHEGRFRC